MCFVFSYRLQTTHNLVLLMIMCMNLIDIFYGLPAKVGAGTGIFVFELEHLLICLMASKLFRYLVYETSTVGKHFDLHHKKSNAESSLSKCIAWLRSDPSLAGFS